MFFENIIWVLGAVAPLKLGDISQKVPFYIKNVINH